MAEPTTAELTGQMRTDWNLRAREDAYYYVAFGRRKQDTAEFISTGADVVRSLEVEMKRLPPADKRSRRALEIGCGPGRLMLPMSWNFGEIHGLDVSDEMIRIALRALHDIPNAFPRVATGADLAHYPAEFFNFVYSYAVFQHIPSREVVFNYLKEARRVLKTGGILRCQINGLPETARKYTTWDGVRIGARDVADFARGADLQLLALEGAGTQYMWVTVRKQAQGWWERVSAVREAPGARIRQVCNSHSGEPAVPARGRFASISIWVEKLPPDCDLNQLTVTVDEMETPPVYIGSPVYDGVCQVNALLPAGLRTGLAPVELRWRGEPLCEPGWVRVVPPPPSVARMVSLTDGVNLLSGNVISSRTVKLCLEELTTPERVEATVDGLAAKDVDRFCTDANNERWEINFTLPRSVAAGTHEVEVRIGRRRLAQVEIEVE